MKSLDKRTTKLVSENLEIVKSQHTIHELYKNEERMQLIRQSYIDIINIVSDAIYVLDESFSFIEVNKGAEIMYQYSREELIGQNPSSVAAEGLNNMERVIELLDSVLQTGNPVRFGFWAKRKNGEIFEKDVIANKAKFFEQNVLVVTAREMNSTLYSEQVLHTSENMFKHMIETSGIGVGTFTVDGKVLFLNKKAKEFLAEVSENYVGKTIVDLLGENLGNEFINRFQKAVISDDILEYEDYVLLASGEYWFATSIKKIIDLDKKLVSIQVQVHNITERKLNENGIKKSKERLNRAEFTSKSGNWELQLDSMQVTASKGAVKIYGLHNQKFSFDEIAKIPMPEYRQALDDALKNLIDKNVPYNIDFKILTADTGEIKDIHSTAYFNKEKRTLFGLIQDVTEQKQTEDVLENNRLLQKRLLFESSNFIESKSDKINYDNITKTILEISGAKYAALNLFENNSSDFRTVSLAGLKNIYEIAQRYLGFDLSNKLWKHDPRRYNKIKNAKINYFDNLTDINEHVLPEKISKLIEYTFNIGQVVVVSIIKGPKSIGDFTLLFEKNKTLQHAEIVELYANQVAMYIERMISAENLIESEERFRKLFESSPLAMSFVGNDGNIELSNKSFSKLFGYDKTDLPTIQQWWIKAYPNEDYRKLVLQQWNDALGKASKSNADIIPKEIRITCKDQTQKDVLVGGIAFNSGFLATFMDVTENNKAMNEVLKREESFRLLFEKNPQPMLIYDLQTLAILEINQTAVDFYGYSYDEFLQMTIRDLHPEVELAHFFNLIEQTRKGINTDGISRHKKKNGELVYAQIMSKPAPILGEHARHVVMEDITQRINAEKELNQKVDELLRFHALTVDRELNMIALKKEVNDLRLKMGKELKYSIPE